MDEQANNSNEKEIPKQVVADPEDIFAVSANPNPRLTPVEGAKPQPQLQSPCPL